MEQILYEIKMKKTLTIKYEEKNSSFVYQVAVGATMQLIMHKINCTNIT